MTDEQPADGTLEWVDPATLRPWPKNPRRNERAVPRVAESIKRLGFGAPLTVRAESREIIAGHTRWKAATSLGLALVPVHFRAGMSDDEAHALAIADNKLGEIADWDDALTFETLEPMPADLVALSGWEADELARLRKENTPRNRPEDEAPAVPTTAVSCVGDVYALGEHRLVCGDATDPAIWTALLGDERLQMVWTDPPYGVSYVGKTKDALTIENDALKPDALREFLFRALRAHEAHCEKGAAWYVAAPPGTPFAEFAFVLGRDGLDVWRHTLTWIKDRFVMGRADYHYRHESIMYGWVPGAAHFFVDDRTLDNVFEIARPARNPDHPTMKPIDLVARCIRNSSKHGWIVGDGFGGSGTTLMACEQEGRRARLVENDPRYCDVIRKRWTKYARDNGIEPGAGALEST